MDTQDKDGDSFVKSAEIKSIHKKKFLFGFFANPTDSPSASGNEDALKDVMIHTNDFGFLSDIETKEKFFNHCFFNKAKITYGYIPNRNQSVKKSKKRDDKEGFWKMTKIIRIKTQNGVLIYDSASKYLNMDQLMLINCAPNVTNITRLSENININSISNNQYQPTFDLEQLSQLADTTLQIYKKLMASHYEHERTSTGNSVVAHSPTHAYGPDCTLSRSEQQFQLHPNNNALNTQRPDSSCKPESSNAQYVSNGSVSTTASISDSYDENTDVEYGRRESILHKKESQDSMADQRKDYCVGSSVVKSTKQTNVNQYHADSDDLLKHSGLNCLISNSSNNYHQYNLENQLMNSDKIMNQLDEFEFNQGSAHEHHVQPIYQIDVNNIYNYSN